ncbi:hypothetical protein ACOMHN_017066 [Nucella lapillus]
MSTLYAACEEVDPPTCCSAWFVSPVRGQDYLPSPVITSQHSAARPACSKATLASLLSPCPPVCGGHPPSSPRGRGPAVTFVMTQEEDWPPGLHGSASYQQLSARSGGSSSGGGHPAHHPRLNVVLVDTIITDSHGNTSRYDSQDDVSPAPAPPGPSKGHAPRKAKGRRNSGPSVSLHGVAPTLRVTPSDCGLRQHQPKANNNNNNNHHHDSSWLGVSEGGGGGGGGGGLLTTPPKSAPSSRPGSPRPEGRTPRSGKKFRTDRRHSTASASQTHHSLMAQEAGGRLHVPAQALTADPLLPNSAQHHNRASSFRESSKTSPRNELRVEDVSPHFRRNSMPNVCNNLLHVPGTSDSGSSGDLADQDQGGIRRVRSFKTTSKGIVVNRGDSFKKKSTHSLMSTGSTVTDSDLRARGGPNGQLDYGGEGARAVAAGGPAYFRVCMMGAAGVGKTSMAHQFLTSDYVDHDDTEDRQPYIEDSQPYIEDRQPYMEDSHPYIEDRQPYMEDSPT